MKSRAESHHDRDDISERLAEIVQDLQAIFVFTPSQAKEVKKPSELTWINLQAQNLTPAPLNPNELSEPSSGNTGCRENNPTDVPILDAWLNDVLRNTLDGLLMKSSFMGGADEKDPLEMECPYCLLSMGEGSWKELHLIKCKYAHEEAEKLEIAKAQWQKRRNC